MRELKIKKTNKKNVKAGYYIKADFMIGDADGWESETYGPFKDPRACMDVIDMLNSVERDSCRLSLERLPEGFLVERGMPRCNVYWLDYFPIEFSEIPEAKKEYITEELIEELYIEIPREPYGDDFCLCKDIEVYYIDEDNKKYKVDYIDDTEGEEDDPRTYLPSENKD